MAWIDLRDKPIAITGASSGIGAATAIACARAGMPVLLGARRADMLEGVAEIIRAEGGRAEVMVCDVLKESDSVALVEKTVETYGSIYSVFANAGVGLEKPMIETSDGELRELFEVNFFATMHTVRAALPHMIRARRGHVLICSSCVARFPLPYNGAYSASKAAQHHVGRALNVELSGYGISVSTVHPVGTKTEFFQTAKDRSGMRGFKMPSHTPERFMQDASVVARGVVKCLRKPRPEVWTSWFVRYGMGIAGVLPRAADRGVRRMAREYEAAKRAGGGHS
jgi:short-subunit dehydrogenase